MASVKLPLKGCQNVLTLTWQEWLMTKWNDYTVYISGVTQSGRPQEPHEWPVGHLSSVGTLGFPTIAVEISIWKCKPLKRFLEIGCYTDMYVWLVSPHWRTPSIINSNTFKGHLGIFFYLRCVCQTGRHLEYTRSVSHSRLIFFFNLSVNSMYLFCYWKYFSIY